MAVWLALSSALSASAPFQPSVAVFKIKIVRLVHLNLLLSLLYSLHPSFPTGWHRVALLLNKMGMPSVPGALKGNRRREGEQNDPGWSRRKSSECEWPAGPPPRRRSTGSGGWMRKESEQ